MRHRGSLETKLDIESHVPFLVNRAATAMLNYSATEFDNFGLTVPQWRVLITLWHYRECRVGELATFTSIEPPTLSRLLNVLTKARYTKRERSAVDPRSFNVSLTTAGRRLFEKTIDFAESVAVQYTEGISASDLAALRRSLKVIYFNAQRMQNARAEIPEEPHEVRRRAADLRMRRPKV